MPSKKYSLPMNLAKKMPTPEKSSEVRYWNPFDFIEFKGTVANAVNAIPQVLNPWRGGQYFMDLHPKVSAVYQHAAGGGNLLSFLAREANDANTPLEEYLKTYSRKNGYRLSLYDAYQSLYRQHQNNANNSKNKSFASFAEFLEFFSKQRLELAPYLLRNFGDPEDIAVFTQYFIGQGIPTKETEVISGPGVKYLYSAALFAAMSEQKAGRYSLKSGKVLLPQGYYQSLISPLGLLDSNIETVKKLDADTIKKHLREGVKALVVTNPNNPNGAIIAKDELKKIAQLIEKYNEEHPKAPVTIISDMIYEGSVLEKGTETSNIVEAYPPIHRYCVSLSAPSKTFGFATSRIAIASTGNPKLLAGMKQLASMQGLYHTNPVSRITTASAFSLINQKWIDRNNAYYKEHLQQALKYISEINSTYGKELLSFQIPQGGWYAVLNLNKEALPSELRPMLSTHMDLWKYLMFYANGQANTGVIAFPGTALGYPDGENLPLVQRVTFGIKPEEIKEMFDRIGQACQQLKTISPEKLSGILGKADGILYKNEREEIKNSKILLFGGGAMGQRLLDSVIKTGIKPQNIAVITRTTQKHPALKQKGVQCYTMDDSLPKGFTPDTTLYAAPPQAISGITKQYADRFVEGAQFLSIAAGLKPEQLKLHLPANVSVGAAWTSITLPYGKTPVPLIFSADTSYRDVRKATHLLRYCGPSVLVDRDAYTAAESVQKIVFPLSLLVSLSEALQYRFNYNEVEAERVVLKHVANYLQHASRGHIQDKVVEGILHGSEGSLPEIIKAASDSTDNPEKLCHVTTRVFEDCWASISAKQGLSKTLSQSLTSELLKSTVLLAQEATERSNSSVSALLKQAATPGGFTASVYNTLFKGIKHCTGVQEVMEKCMDTVAIRFQQLRDPNYIEVEKYLRSSLKDVNSFIGLTNVEASKGNAANFYFSIPHPSHALSEKCRRLLPSNVCKSPRSFIKNGQTSYMIQVTDIKEAAEFISKGVDGSNLGRSR